MKTNTKRWAMAVGLLLLVAAPALADDQLVGIGTNYWGYRFTASTTPACVKRNATSSSCAVFPAGRRADHLQKAVTVVSEGAACCCWSFGQNGEQTLNTSACQVRDVFESTAVADGKSGSGGCHIFPAIGGVWTTRADRKALIATDAAGQRPGLCSTVTSTTGESVFMPCDADADCSTAESGVHVAGTCMTSDLDTVVAGLNASRSAAAGLRLICAGVSGSVVMGVMKDLVVK